MQTPLSLRVLALQLVQHWGAELTWSLLLLLPGSRDIYPLIYWWKQLLKPLTMVSPLIGDPRSKDFKWDHTESLNLVFVSHTWSCSGEHVELGRKSWAPLWGSCAPLHSSAGSGNVQMRWDLFQIEAGRQHFWLCSKPTPQQNTGEVGRWGHG